MVVRTPKAPREKEGQRRRLRAAAARASTRARSAKYAVYLWRRMLRARATPHEIAIGCASGVFAACTPFLGFQMALAAVLALALRGSLPAAVAGTFIGNPVSWPAIWSASYVAGAWALGLDPAYAADAINGGVDALEQSIRTPTPQAIEAAVDNLSPIFQPLVIGGLLVGLALAALSYYPTRRAAHIFQMRRARL
ncbi:MAG: DUF2062 domain-containing protein [Hyphomicrobium sp.]